VALSKATAPCDRTAPTPRRLALGPPGFPGVLAAGGASASVFGKPPGRLWGAGLRYFVKCLLLFHRSSNGLD